MSLTFFTHFLSLYRLAGFFNEQPQMMALATSPVARSPAPGIDVELAQLTAASGGLGSGGGGGSRGDLAARNANLSTPISLDTALAEASGRSDGLSSPVLREKALQGIGTLGAALEAELSRVAAWRQAKWEARKGWAATPVNNASSGAIAGASTNSSNLNGAREEEEEPLMGNSNRLDEEK